MLNNNLVIELIDRDNKQSIFTFIGNKKPVNTAKTLLNFAKKKQKKAQLRYINTAIKRSLESSDLHLEENRNDFEYLYDVPKLAKLAGKKFKSKRVLAQRFLRENPDTQFTIEDIHSLRIRRQLLQLVKKWSLNKKKGGKDYDYRNEKRALKRLLSNGKDTDLVLSCVRIDKKIIAFSIDEVLPRRKAIGHFVKADTSYKGIYEYINQQTALYLEARRVRTWNWQQDLGLEGLRKLKQSYHPIELLDKYTITTNT